MGRRRTPLVAVLLSLLVLAGLGGPQQGSAAVGTVHFAAAGDFGATTATSAVLTGIAQAQPDLALAVGDLSYGTTGEEQAWCDFVTARVGAGFPFELVSGNHESNGINGHINDFSACLPNQLPGVVGTYGRQWYVDYPRQAPAVRFVMISPGITYPDGTWSYTPGSPRYQWTAAAIDGARTAGIPWVVVGMHKTCLTLGQHPCDGGTAVNDLLVSKRVDLVVNGHEHLYQRTKQLALSAACPSIPVGTFDADCVRDADADLVAGAGTVFATTGTGGHSLRAPDAADAEVGYFAAWMGSNSPSPSTGYLDVSADSQALTARFVATSGSYTDAFTIRKSSEPAPNQPPVASIAPPSCSGLSCSFDGSGSSDPDGRVVSWSWSFGDGSTGTGATPARTYAAPGTYTVTLTVTDDQGGTASATRSVEVSSSAPPIAADEFSRTVTNGLGTADVGGAWTARGSTTNLSVSAGAGRIRIPAGASPGGYLNAVSTQVADVRASVAIDKLPLSTSLVRVNLLARRVPNAGYYQLRLDTNAAGDVRAYLDRGSATSAETSLVPSQLVPGGRYTAGQVLRVRVEASGGSPTRLRAKVWPAGTTEPAAWLLATTDSTAALQAPGGLGVVTYLSSSATNAPLTVSVDDLQVVAATP